MPAYHPNTIHICSHHVLFGLLLPTNFKPWRQFTLACAMVKNTVEIGSYRLQGHCEVTWGRQEGLPPQWSLLVCNSISNKHGGFIGKSSINGKNSRKRSENKGTHTHTLWMEVYGSENHRTDGNYKWIHHIPRPQTWLGNRWTQWFIMEIICNQHIIFIRDFPDHLWFPVFYWQICCGSWKPRPTSCPDKTRWFGTSMWQIRSGGRGHIPIPSKAVNQHKLQSIYIPNVYSWEILSFLAGLTTLVVSFLCDPAAKKKTARQELATRSVRTLWLRTLWCVLGQRPCHSTEQDGPRPEIFIIQVFF